MATPTTQAAKHAAQTRCKRGHPLSGENLYLYDHRRADGRVYRLRMCKACQRERGRRYRAEGRYRTATEPDAEGPS